MLDEALKSNFECLFVAMSNLAYVPRTLKVVQLLEQELEVFPDRRYDILPTIYQLEYPITKWHLENSGEDLKLLKDLIVGGGL